MCRYLDGLMGPYPAAKDVYIQRSPIHAADKIKAPVILFQVRRTEIQSTICRPAAWGAGRPRRACAGWPPLGW